MTDGMMRIFKRWQELDQAYPINEGYDQCIILRSLSCLFEVIADAPEDAEELVDDIVEEIKNEGTDNVNLLVSLFRELSKAYYGNSF